MNTDIDSVDKRRQKQKGLTFRKRNYKITA